MKLEKLTIYVEKQSFTPIEVLINPNQLTIVKTGWKTSDIGLVPAVDEPDTLDVDLFFDTSLPQPTDRNLARSAFTMLVGRSALVPSLGGPQDVRKYTKPIVDLAEARGNLGKQPRPPICQLCWGNHDKPFFQGVLKTVTQTFTRFLENGTPVRATLGCAFEEWEDAEYQQKAQNPVDDPIRVVRQGETLSSIATEEYGDPTLWRVIAAENRLDNPRQLFAGQRLTVPPLRLNSLDSRR